MIERETSLGFAADYQNAARTVRRVGLLITVALAAFAALLIGLCAWTAYHGGGFSIWFFGISGGVTTAHVRIAHREFEREAKLLEAEAAGFRQEAAHQGEVAA